MSVNDDSGIDYGKGGTMFHGPDAVACFQAFTLASALKLFGNHGIRPSRHVTPTGMMQMAERITGQKFKKRDYLVASEAVRQWAVTMKAALPKTVDGVPVP